MKLRNASTLLITLFLAIASAHAEAAIDEKLVYPGANCRKTFGTIGSGDPTPSFDGMLTYSGSGFISATCPLYDNGPTFTGDIWVVNNNPAGQELICDSKAGNPLESNQVFQSKSAFPSSAVQQLHFDGPAKGGTFTFRYYHCSMPSGSRIVNYRGIAQ